MKQWSKLKKTLIIAVGLFLVLGIVSIATDNQTKQNIQPSTSMTTTNSPTTDSTPKVQPSEVGQKIASPAKTETPVTVTPLPSTPASDCDPNYSGCVPIASDVDCAGGSGNGPAYVSGPINVIGTDIYGLDRDGDNIACE